MAGVEVRKAPRESSPQISPGGVPKVVVVIGVVLLLGGAFLCAGLTGLPI